MLTQYVNKTNIDNATRYYKDSTMKILHRSDGPAVIRTDGSKLWYINGKCNRDDGPAVEWSDGSKQWYINGKQLTEEQFLDLTKLKY